MKKKVLLLIPQPVIPPKDGGKQGIYVPMQKLASLFNVKAIIFADTDENADASPYNALGIDVLFCKIQRRDSSINAVLNLFQYLPFKFKKYYHKKYQLAIDAICREWQPDFLLCHHSHLAFYCKNYKKKFPFIKLILRAHNLEYLLVKQYAAYDNILLRKFFAKWQYFKTKKIELRSLEYFNEVLFISDSDIAEVNPSVHFKSTLLYDSTLLTGITGQHKKNIFLFSGNVHTIQNKINLRHFICHIWIPWKENYQSHDFELWITGSPEEEILKEISLDKTTAEKFSIRPCGFIDDITLFMQNAKYIISPSLIGAGIRVKVIEALGAGCVIFLTPVDAAMLHLLQDEINCIIYSTISEFNCQFEKFENDDEAYKNIGESAYNTAALFLSRDRFYDQLLLAFTK